MRGLLINKSNEWFIDNEKELLCDNSHNKILNKLVNIGVYLNIVLYVKND